MKKTVLIVSSLLLLICALTYALLFTGVGNALLKPYIEAKINENAPLKVEVSEFVLRMDRLRVLLKLDEENSLLAEGIYSLFKQSFDIDYSVQLKRLSNFSEIAKRQLSGRLQSEGKVSGDLDLFKIKGQSNLALSQTDYAIIFQEMKLNKAAVKLSDLNIKELLSMAGEKPYSKGKIDLHIQLYDLNQKDMHGSVVLDLKEADLNAEVIQKEFGLKLTKTALQSQSKATFQGENLKFLIKLDSEPAALFSKGEVELADKAIDAEYRVDIKELALLKSITNSPLRGALFTQGQIKGNEKELLVKGRSDIAGSDSTYDIKLQELKLSKAIIHIKDAYLNRLLYMAGQSRFANARINADIELNDLSAKNLNGKANIKLSEGKFDNKIMEKEFDLKLPQTKFELLANSDLSPENIRYSLSLNSNLARIDSSGSVKPKNIETEALYKLNIQELGLLKPLTKAPFRGPLATSGKISGDRKELEITGKSDLAASQTTYRLLLKDLSLHSAKASIQNAELSKLLYLAGERNYAQGKLALDAEMSSFSPLNAKIKLSLSEGLAHSKVIKKAFDISLPYTKFDLKSDAEIKEGKLTAKSTLNSNLATLYMKKTSLDIESASLSTDYLVKIPSLERLEPIIERKLFGAVTANGEIKKNKKLILTAHSDIFNGRFNARLEEEKLNADFKEIHAIGVLKMLGYPEVMDAPINGTLNYNTKSEKGRLESRFEKATLSRSKLTEIISQFSRTDLTKERFNEGSLVSNINKEIISSDLQMQSKTVTLKSKKFIINSKKQLIDARFALKVKKYPGDVIVKGEINSPKVSLDAKSVITPEIEEKVGKEINRFLKKLF